MFLASLVLALNLIAPPAPACQRTHRETPITPQECWAWIVMGESGGHWKQASLLVAWTLRAWELNLGMPAGDAGRLWGWYGWAEPNAEAVAAVETAFGRPMSESPFDFMQLGAWCIRLGSGSDVRLWQGTRAWGIPDFRWLNPTYPNYSINCYAPQIWSLRKDRR